MLAHTRSGLIGVLDGHTPPNHLVEGNTWAQMECSMAGEAEEEADIEQGMQQGCEHISSPASTRRFSASTPCP